MATLQENRAPPRELKYCAQYVDEALECGGSAGAMIAALISVRQCSHLYKRTERRHDDLTF